MNVSVSGTSVSSVTQSCPALCDPMDCSMPGFPVHHQLLEPTQTHVHDVGDAIQPPHPLLSPSRPALNLSQHQGLCQWVCSSHQVAKVLEFQLQHQGCQWIFRTDYLWDWWTYLNLIISKVSSSNTTTLGVRISINRLWGRHKPSVHNHSHSSSFRVSLLGLLTILHFKSACGEAASGFLECSLL